MLKGDTVHTGTQKSTVYYSLPQNKSPLLHRYLQSRRQSVKQRLKSYCSFTSLTTAAEVGLGEWAWTPDVRSQMQPVAHCHRPLVFQEWGTAPRGQGQSLGGSGDNRSKKRQEMFRQPKTSLWRLHPQAGELARQPWYGAAEHSSPGRPEYQCLRPWATLLCAMTATTGRAVLLFKKV